MQVVNEVFPTDPERVRQMMEPGPNKPIYMVNLPLSKRAWVKSLSRVADFFFSSSNIYN